MAFDGRFPADSAALLQQSSPQDLPSTTADVRGSSGIESAVGSPSTLNAETASRAKKSEKRAAALCCRCISDKVFRQ